VKTIALVSAVTFLVCSLAGDAPAQQNNMGTPRKGAGMGYAPPTFHVPGASVPGPSPTIWSTPGSPNPSRWGTFQTAPSRTVRNKTR
jgi:hypothetical protein